MWPWLRNIWQSLTLFRFNIAAGDVILMLNTIMVGPLHLMRNQLVYLILDSVSVGMFIITENIWWISFELCGILWHFLNLTIQCLFLTEVRLHLLLAVCVFRDVPFGYFRSFYNPGIGKSRFIKYGRLKISILSKPMVILIKISFIVNFSRLNFLVENPAMRWTNLTSISIILCIHTSLKPCVWVNVWLIFYSWSESWGFCTENVWVLGFLHISVLFMNYLYNWIYLNIFFSNKF